MIPKYRAWGRNGDYPGTPSEKFEMFYDVSVVTTYQDKMQHVIADFGMYNESEYNGTEIIDYTLMQSTGLTDKNGKEIFEGDILKVTNLSSWLEVVSFNEDKAMFVSKETKRKVEETPLYDLFNTDIFEVEIIGNIYENPELVEVSS